jgi:type II secretory pathway pseudopilin PulG
MKICNLKLKIGNLGKRGFSIIELVFAMCFLTIIILGVVNLQSSNLAMINRQNNQIQAHFYANQGIQILKAIGYSDIDDACSGSGKCLVNIQPSGNSYSFSTSPPEKLADGLFDRTIEIDKSTGLTNALKVTSIVEWTDSTGEHRRTTDADGKTVNAGVEAKAIIF